MQLGLAQVCRGVADAQHPSFKTGQAPMTTRPMRSGASSFSPATFRRPMHFADEELTGVPCPKCQGQLTAQPLDQPGRSAIHEPPHLSGLRQLPGPPQVPQAGGQHVVWQTGSFTKPTTGMVDFLPQQGRTVAPPRPRTLQKEKPSGLQSSRI